MLKYSEFNESSKLIGEKTPSIELDKKDILGDYFQHNLENAKDIVFDLLMDSLKHNLEEIGCEIIANNLYTPGSTNILGVLYFNYENVPFLLDFTNNYNVWLERLVPGEGGYDVKRIVVDKIKTLSDVSRLVSKEIKKTH